jgi:tetratricopeptide (TPR) repeat protein
MLTDESRTMKRFSTTAFLALISLWLAACTSQESRVNHDGGMFDQVFERQKSGLGLDQTALDNLEKVPQRAPDEYERSGDMYVQQGSMPLAQLQYAKALEGDPNRNLTRYKLGLLHLKQGQWREAYALFKDMLTYESTSALAHEGMGQADLLLNNEGAAEQEFYQALTLDPKLWKAHSLLGVIYDRQRRHQEAIAQYKAALNLQPADASTYNNLGLAYYLAGQYEDALQSFQQALARGLRQPKTYNNMALTYAKLGRYQEALESFKAATDEAQAYNNLGVIYLETGKARQSITCFEKAMELAPRHYSRASENLTAAKQEGNRLPDVSLGTRADPQPCP